MRFKKFLRRGKLFLIFWLYCVCFTLFLNQFNYIISFLMPVTTFNYNLISLHNDIFWFIIIILTLVYWALYKIWKDFSWNLFKRQKGNSRIQYRYRLYYIVSIITALGWIWIMGKITKLYEKFVENSFLIYFHLKLKEEKGFINIFKKAYLLIFGLEFFKGRQPFVMYSKISMIKELISERFIFHKLYSYTNNSRFYYNGKKGILHILKFHHSIILEYIFAIFPTAIIIWILIPSFYLLYSLDDDSYPFITIKVIGHQWFWSYEFDNFIKDKFISYNFDSVLVQESDLSSGDKRLLTVDERLLVPTAANIRFLITSSDVLHSWAIPEFGLKVDAIPGRLNEFITIICKPGIYFGQCSELCGVAHGYMPIVVEAIHPEIWQLAMLDKSVTLALIDNGSNWVEEAFLQAKGIKHHNSLVLYDSVLKEDLVKNLRVILSIFPEVDFLKIYPELKSMGINQEMLSNVIIQNNENKIIGITGEPFIIDEDFKKNFLRFLELNNAINGDISYSRWWIFWGVFERFHYDFTFYYENPWNFFKLQHDCALMIKFVSTLGPTEISQPFEYFLRDEFNRVWDNAPQPVKDFWWKE